jgi:hypothetical protein
MGVGGLLQASHWKRNYIVHAHRLFHDKRLAIADANKVPVKAGRRG